MSKKGPVFENTRPHGVDIYFCNHFFGNITLNKGILNSSPSFKTNGELNNKNENFESKELEVYKVIIN